MPAQEIIPSALGQAIKAEDAPHVSGDKGIPAMAIRASADTVTTDADGDYTLLKVDEEGRLKVASKPASYADITGDITAIQATIGTPVAGGTVVGDVSRASNVMLFCTGTFAGVNVTFEGSLEGAGETNWFGIQVVRTNANTIETATGVLAAQPVYAWEASVNGLKRIRVRCTARTSGTQSWRMVLGTYATEPIPAAQASATQAVSGTVTASITQLIYGDSSTNLAASATFTGTSRDGGATATYSYFMARVRASHAGTLFVEESDNGTTWFVVKSQAVAGAEVNAIDVTVPVVARYHRVRYVNGATLQTQFRLNSGYLRS